MESDVDKLTGTVDNLENPTGRARAEQNTIESMAVVDRSNHALPDGHRLQT
jgi:hypothetical protein